MIGSGYWTTGITVSWRNGSNGHAWSSGLKFMDDGFCNDDVAAGIVSTEGELHTRYYVDDTNGLGLSVALDVLIADARTLNIRFGAPGVGLPSLYMEGDGEDPDVEYPEGWEGRLAAETERLGWAPIEGEIAPDAIASGTRIAIKEAAR